MKGPWSQPPIVDQANAAITGGTGVRILLAQSYVAVATPADTTEDTLATITIPANTLGSNGKLELRCEASWTNSANNKQIRIRFNGGAGTDLVGTAVFTTTAVGAFFIYLANRNATNSQKYRSEVTYGTVYPGNAGAIFQNGGTLAIDTTAATTIVITGQKASAGETLQLEGYTVDYVKASNA